MRGTRQRGNAGSGTLECFFLNSEQTVCAPRLYGDMRATLKSVAQVFEVLPQSWVDKDDDEGDRAITEIPSSLAIKKGFEHSSKP